MLLYFIRFKLFLSYIFHNRLNAKTFYLFAQYAVLRPFFVICYFFIIQSVIEILMYKRLHDIDMYWIIDVTSPPGPKSTQIHGGFTEDNSPSNILPGVRVITLNKGLIYLITCQQ